MRVSRRAALALFPLSAAGILAGCGVFSSTTTNGVTTITVNTAKLVQYGAAISGFNAAMQANPLVVAALGPTAAVVGTLVLDIATAAATLNNQAGGTATLSFDATSIPAALTAVETDANTVFQDFGAVFAKLGASVGTTVVQSFDAFQTIVALLLALIPTAAAEAALHRPKAVMSEAQALAVLGVR